MRSIELNVTKKAIKKLRIGVLEYCIFMILIGMLFIINLNKVDVSRVRVYLEGILAVVNAVFMIEGILRLINIRHRSYVEILNNEIIIRKDCIVTKIIHVNDVYKCKVMNKNIELVDKNNKSFKIEIDKLSLEDNKILKDYILSFSNINIEFEKEVGVWAKQS
ncbi:hypothetical protein SAMN02745163_01720 [Clostridium cavendishii DSM 21758]|uniref:Uncharacterized protein n=1 Tax=Clostridium cavendishii DSM 21758 TaxID=1121302 RepID=A0A1M6I7L9_9CLOT|nr:hypothetical protein [Clostridium cavendishii]SHJ30422.1 hypothetical protein SAMN02745163_01720 [Clostridium cavendishii DSM 21758]